ncbi:hypothetical protein [Chroococcidiopsis cubana]|uniref:hypothetical protein n=1 Tax=Chroococcidiopsis cubana TaxID=171392 RepID=UPI0013151FE6|nr:hypothetical protein [Chroococcidiopsis cubana]
MSCSLSITLYRGAPMCASTDLLQLAVDIIFAIALVSILTTDQATSYQNPS